MRVRLAVLLMIATVLGCGPAGGQRVGGPRARLIEPDPTQRRFLRLHGVYDATTPRAQKLLREANRVDEEMERARQARLEWLEKRARGGNPAEIRRRIAAQRARRLRSQPPRKKGIVTPLTAPTRLDLSGSEERAVAAAERPR